MARLILIFFLVLLLFSCKSKPEKITDTSTESLIYERVYDQSTRTYGYRDNHGNMTIPFGIYRSLQDDEKGMIIANKDFKKGYIDIHNNILIPFEYETLRIFSEDLAFARREAKGKFGVIDRQGNTVIPFIFDDYSHFRPNGLAAVTIDQKWGFINRQGDTIIPIRYSKVKDSKFDKIVLVKSRNKWAFFSNTGKQLTPFQYDEILEIELPIKDKQHPQIKPERIRNFGFTRAFFSNNRVLVKQNGRYHYLDTNLQRTALSRNYTYAEPFKQDSATIVAYKGKYGVIDLDENFIFSPSFSKIEHPKPYPGGEFRTPNENFFIAKKNNLIQIWDKHLRPLSKEEFKSYEFHSINSGDSTIYLFILRNKANQTGAINGYGQETIPFEYQSLDVSRSCIAKKDGKYGLINFSNEILYPFTCDKMEKNFRSDDIITMQGKKYGLIDSCGHEILPMEYENIESFHANARQHFIVKQNGKFGKIDRNKNIIIPIEFDYISNWREYSPKEIQYVRKGNKYGIYRQDGKILLPVVYDNLCYHRINYVQVKQNNKQGIVNFQDSAIIPIEFDAIYVHLQREILKNEELFIYTKKNDEYSLFDDNCNLVKKLTKEEFDKIYRDIFAPPFIP